MEVKPFHLGCGASFGPPGPELGSAQRIPLWRGEYESVGLGADVLRQVGLEYRHQFVGHRNCTLASVGLGWPEKDAAIAEFYGLLGDLDRSMKEVNAGPTQPGEFSESQRAPGGQQDHRSKWRVDRIGDLLQLARHRDWPLGCVFPSGAFHLTRVRAGQYATSDPISFAVHAGASLAVSAWVEGTATVSVHYFCNGCIDSYATPNGAGNQTLDETGTTLTLATTSAGYRRSKYPGHRLR